MSWTTRTATGISNVHQRHTPGPLSRAGELLELVAAPENPLWPSDRWPPLVLDNGLEPGSDGGHGPIRYRVVEHQPGRSVRFAMDDSIRGGHTLSVEPVPGGPGEPEQVCWRHELVIERPSLLIRAIVVPLHDALLEDLLDGADAAMRQRPLRRRTLSRGVRARLWLMERVESPAKAAGRVGRR
ncbi:SRPBCC family protein [Nakamurella aerolata]|uniref:SRPBCC family protein n=1 Tax=Nakamurella aerolata TaxID=1656892 RepID=A0A849AI23_9ACTN|nr:SRPBCC family protein [Nakamurella aerolata]NNG36472.1 SRPBCC family protein [Nakamurella aerolata]